MTLTCVPTAARDFAASGGGIPLMLKGGILIKIIDGFLTR
jgi:uncharacterized protein (UPF0303 family)